jgi:hypothetical protein
VSTDDDLRNRMQIMASELLEATREGKISWRLTDVEDKFIYAGTRSSVTIQLTQDRFEGDATILSLRNNRGTVVDSIETEGKQIDDRWIAAPWNELLDDLYHAARRVAHNVDEALDSMMADIERGTPSPDPSPKKKAADPWASDGFNDEPPF